jgi:lipopolysaccharide transport system ATP-binding protein
METAIRARNLTKQYEIYSRPRDILIEAFTGRARGRHFLALNDVSFDVRRGEVLGVIGRNGAGKSTLLKLVAGTLSPSAGAVAVAGRVSAILELGAGFHPEQTGLDNIIVGGLCLGLPRQELNRKLDWIVDFSELEAFIHQPLKTYSTGMRARLAFAVAAALEPDILIIDEALSVGDLRFQKKCFRHIESIKARGATILFVSHDTNAISAIANRAVLLERGRLILDAEPVVVTKHYQQMLFEQEIDGGRGGAPVRAPSEAPPGTDRLHGEPESAVRAGVTEAPVGVMSLSPASASAKSPAPIAAEREDDVTLAERRYGQGDVRITEIVLLGPDGKATNAIGVGEPFTIRLGIAAARHADLFYVGFRINTRYGQDVYGSSTHLRGEGFRLRAGARGEAAIRCEGHLAPGDYFITASLALDHNLMFDRRVDALHFKVIGNIPAYRTSIANLNSRILFERASASDGGEGAAMIRPPKGGEAEVAGVGGPRPDGKTGDV